MQQEIYIQLLEEGTKVYRAVPAIELEKNIFEVRGHDIYELEDEVWEFLPGTHVEVEEQKLNGNLVLIAIREKINCDDS